MPAEDRLWKALVLMALGTLLLLWMDGAQAQTPQEVVRVIQALNPAPKRWERHYYAQKALDPIARAILIVARVRGFSPWLLVAIIQEQSRFHHDAVSRYNRVKLEKGKPWRQKRPQRGQDWGLFQHHWPGPYCGNVRCWKKLKDPVYNIQLANLWMRDRYQTCRNALKSRRCGKLCRRCKRTRRLTGWLWWSGHPRKVGKILKQIEEERK